MPYLDLCSPHNADVQVEHPTTARVCHIRIISSGAMIAPEPCPPNRKDASSFSGGNQLRLLKTIMLAGHGNCRAH
jgi:hypothetical protein